MWEANNIMNILVTGALGNVGICTINELLKNKDNYIVGIDNCITRSTNRLLHINDPNNRFTFINSNNTFNTFFDAIYWATVSLTTVGYGDIYAVSVIGKIITMISSLFGIALIAMPASIITSGILVKIKQK